MYKQGEEPEGNVAEPKDVGRVLGNDGWRRYDEYYGVMRSMKVDNGVH